jgi:hypothetical protein
VSRMRQRSMSAGPRAGDVARSSKRPISAL